MALVMNDSYIDLDTAYFDLPNSHLVLGGSGNATLDLARIDNRTDAILAGGADRISGFGTLTKNGDSIWTLTGANTTDAANVFLSADIEAGILTLDNSTLALTSGAASSASLLARSLAQAPTAQGAMSIASGAALSSVGTSAVMGDVANYGTILLANNYQGGNGHFAGDRLSITGNYTGNGASLLLDTVLGDETSATDRLIIGGSASGQTLIGINNVNGGGARTNGDGIMVVEALAGASTTTDAFRLNGRVAAGAYDYSLYRGGSTGDDSWYLRSEMQVAGTKVAAYRAEVPLMASVTPVALEYGYAMLGTLHERVGDTWAAPIKPGFEEVVVCGADGKQAVARMPVKTGKQLWFAGAWGRLIGDRGFQDSGNFERNGASYDYTFGGIQTGLDIFAREGADGSLDKLGIYVGYGQIDANVKGAWQGKAGTIDMDAYTVGAYWTHKAAQGWYTDAVVQGTWYEADANSTVGQQMKSDGFGFLASLEGGYAFQLGNGFALEPQAQLVYQNLSFDDVSDAYGRFDLGSGESLRGRLGLRLTKTFGIGDAAKPRMLTTWLRANIWHEFMGDNKTTVSGQAGGNPYTVSSSLGGTWAEIGTGVSGQISDNISLFATGSYNHSLDNGGREAWNGRLGMTVKW